MAEDLSKDILTEFRKEVGELKTLIKSLKSILGEIRALLSDLTSPYSMLKSIPTSVTTTKKMQKISGASEQTNTSKEVKEGETIEETTRELQASKEKKPASVRELHEILKELGTTLEKEYEKEKPRLDIKKVIRMIRTIYNLRKAVPKESIDNIIKLSEILGLISHSDKEILDIVCSLVEDALKHNLTPNEQIPLMYLLLKSLGYVNEDLEEEVTKIVSDVIISASKKRSTTHIVGEDKSLTQRHDLGSSTEEEGRFSG